LKRTLLLILVVICCLPPINMLAQGEDPVRLQVSDAGAFVYKVPEGWVVEGSREELLLASSELALFLMENSPTPIAQLPEGETIISLALMDPQVIIATFDLPEEATPVELLDSFGFWINGYVTLEAAVELEFNGQPAALSRNIVDGQILNTLLYFLLPDRIAVVTILSNGEIPSNAYDIIETIHYRRQADIYEADDLIADVPTGWDVEMDNRVYTISNVIQKATRPPLDLGVNEYVFIVMNLTPEDSQHDAVDVEALALELAENAAVDNAEISGPLTFRLPDDLVPVEGRSFVQVKIQSETNDAGGVVVTQNNHQQTVALIYAAGNGDGETIAWTAIWTALTVRFK
jgi:hypothetical protein